MQHLCGLFGHLFFLKNTSLQFGNFIKRHFQPVPIGSAGTLAFCGFLLSLFFGCAQIIPPTGGPDDLTPPKLDTLRSTPNYQTRFQKQDIVLTFNEWVELKEVFTQVVISPPLEFRPEITRKKKSIVLKFDEKEVLRDSATYVINYGEAIRDITKGNVAPIVFVFSTGDYIDSLSVKGKVVDAYTGKPTKDVLFMLYENLSDTVVRKDRPFYFAKTDTSGRFQVDNVKSGTFKAFALLDKNLNYRYDSEAEMIGFPDSFLVLSSAKLTIDTLELDTLLADSTQVDLPDSVVVNTALVDSFSLAQDSLLGDSLKTTLPLGIPTVNIRLFQESKKLFLREKEVGIYGRVNLGFSRAPFDATISFDSVGQTAFFETEKDSIWLWYSLAEDAPWNIYVQRDTSIDTVLVKTGLRTSFFSTAQLVSWDKIPTKAPLQHPFKAYPVIFNYPLDSFDLGKIQLLEDSTQVPVQPKVVLDTALRRKLLVDFKWKQGKLYELIFLPGSVMDIYGLSNADSIARKFTVGQEKDYGTLTLKVLGLDSSAAYVIRILAKNETLFEEYNVDGTADFQKTIPYMTPDTYSVELIEDLDRNGRWTTGNYDLRRQPERIQRKVLEELRANWEVEATVGASFE